MQICQQEAHWGGSTRKGVGVQDWPEGGLQHGPQLTAREALQAGQPFVLSPVKVRGLALGAAHPPVGMPAALG